MRDDEKEYVADLQACVSDLGPLLRRLSDRYSELVVVAALAEHVGGGLRILTERGLCTEDQALQVLRQLEEAMASQTREN